MLSLEYGRIRGGTSAARGWQGAWGAGGQRAGAARCCCWGWLAAGDLRKRGSRRSASLRSGARFRRWPGASHPPQQHREAPAPLRSASAWGRRGAGRGSNPGRQGGETDGGSSLGVGNDACLRGCSSNGRALAQHARGTGIDTLHLHCVVGVPAKAQAGTEQGFEPWAFCMQNRRSTTELHPRTP